MPPKRKAPVEEPTEKPAKKPAKEPAKKAAKQPAKQPAKKAAKEPAAKATRQPSKRSGKRAAEEPADQLAEQPAKKQATGASKASAKAPAKAPAKKPAGKPAKQPAKRSAEQAAEQPAKRQATRAAKAAAKAPAKAPAKKPAKKPAEKPANTRCSQRTKVNHTKPAQPEAPAVSPTIVPALPEPIPPTQSFAPSAEEFAFFDRVKKFIGNKQVFGEFLKLCNLYTTDFIDKNVLVNKASGYIGANSEIMAWFKRFMNLEPTDEIIEPKPKGDSSHVNLSHCRCLGPSYRLLPRRERQKPCSGRDEMCRSVLNDEWASHPTWASEDSGFVAHKKNQFEDSLHRIEEDRHDYDHHIEACIRTIQLMEPLVQQLSIMTEAERANFKLPPGLGGQSETIYKRVIKKIYDREKGLKVIEDMFSRPTIVLPIVLYRLKQKAEEWKASQVSYYPSPSWFPTTNRSTARMGQSLARPDAKGFLEKPRSPGNSNEIRR